MNPSLDIKRNIMDRRSAAIFLFVGVADLLLRGLLIGLYYWIPGEASVWFLKSNIVIFAIVLAFNTLFYVFGQYRKE